MANSNAASLERPRTRSRRSIALLAYSAVLTLVVAPLIYNAYLRSSYVNVMAQWASKVRRPTYALIGDSITAGGGIWGWRLAGAPLSAINFGANGSMLRQVAGQAKTALTFHPRYLLIEGGVNDTIFSGSDQSAWGSGLEDLTKQANDAGAVVVLTLPLPTSNPLTNVALTDIRNRLRRQFAGQLCVDATSDLAPQGRLKPEYTVDGVHFTNAGYRVWANAIRRTIATGARC